MPGLTNGGLSMKKRKRESDVSVKGSKRRVVADPTQDARKSTIEELEEDISGSKRHYQNVATLLSMLELSQPQAPTNLAVSLSLCKVFSRLAVDGSLGDALESGDQEGNAPWLRTRYREYLDALLTLLKDGDGHVQVRLNCDCEWRVRLTRSRLLP